MGEIIASYVQCRFVALRCCRLVSNPVSLDLIVNISFFIVIISLIITGLVFLRRKPFCIILLSMRINFTCLYCCLLCLLSLFYRQH